MTYYARNLPHWHPAGRTLFVTWRLYGSIPAAVREKLNRRSALKGGRQFARFDKYLDHRDRGPFFLRDERIANLVVASLRHGREIGHYILHAYVVMPNHVHVLLDPLVDLSRCTRGIKNPTARDANRLLGRTGRPFWQDESFDHWVRNGSEFERIVWYIENNPVSAGLVHKANNWRWSSAYGREAE